MSLESVLDYYSAYRVFPFYQLMPYTKLVKGIAILLIDQESDLRERLRESQQCLKGSGYFSLAILTGLPRNVHSKLQ